MRLMPRSGTTCNEQGESEFAGWGMETKRLGMYQQHVQVLPMPRAEDVFPSALPCMLGKCQTPAMATLADCMDLAWGRPGMEVTC